jgi:hypothetical protein
MLSEIRARRLIDPDAGFLVSRPNPAKGIAALLADESAAVASAASGSRLQIRTRSVMPPPILAHQIRPKRGVHFQLMRQASAQEPAISRGDDLVGVCSPDEGLGRGLDL